MTFWQYFDGLVDLVGKDLAVVAINKIVVEAHISRKHEDKQWYRDQRTMRMYGVAHWFLSEGALAQRRKYV